MKASGKVSGNELEARALRLYLAQGMFAERGLIPAATPDRRMLATDIDVLVSEYTSGFHLTRRHVECKTGKFPLLDRVLWLSGVRQLLRADSTSLLGDDVDLAASEFARGLEVELFTLQHLQAWEKSLGIPAELWPCRSDYLTFDTARARWIKQSGDREADEGWRPLRETMLFIEVEGWLGFRYRHLNKLLRLLSEIVRQWSGIATNKERELCARYAFSASLVRLGQYMLAICGDVANVLPTELEKHLTLRLTFGDQEPTQAAALVEQTAKWIERALSAKGATLPAEIDVSRLTASPSYAPDLVELVRKVLEHSYEARYLPLALERLQFGVEADDKLPRFRAAAQVADSLAAHVRAFVVRAFSTPKELSAPVRGDLMATYRGSGMATAAPVGKAP